MTERRRIRIEVPVLTRVEGEGALHLAVDGDRITDLRLRIFEPPRYFEKFLEGRHYDEVIDVVARICGICPVAYQVTAAQAIEAAFGVELPPEVARLRRALYCGEWLQSHALHVHLLAAPDFLGHDNAVSLAGEYPEIVHRGLRLQGLGNALISLFGGRSVHPVGLRVGGFHRVPARAEVASLLESLDAARRDARDLQDWAASLAMPGGAQAFTTVALRAADGYAIDRGRIVSSTGLDLSAEEFEDHFSEFQAPHSTALHAHLDGAPYLVGPLARLNSNGAQLDGLPPGRFPSGNMFDSLLARAVEIRYAIEEAIRLLADYREPAQPAVPVQPCAGGAAASSEAPRGMLWHRYGLTADGLVSTARIVPPTSQNQARIEQDLAQGLEALGLDSPEPAMRQHCETIIRNYDPCISCATHFLRLSLDRR